MIIFGSILTTFELRSIFWGSWGSIENLLEPKIEPPLENLVCRNLWNALYDQVSISPMFYAQLFSTKVFWVFFLCLVCVCFFKERMAISEIVDHDLVSFVWHLYLKNYLFGNKVLFYIYDLLTKFIVLTWGQRVVKEN